MTLRARGALAAILALFISTAMLFVSRPGIEADEALVANPAFYSWHSIPLMHFSYVGALKTWLYAGIFAIVKPGPVSLRMPTVLLGAAAVLLFFLLLDWTIGRRAAWIGALLLATDSMFVILEAIDFGPNALHFVLKLGAMLLLVRFDHGLDHKNSARTLAAAFFLVGLGLWDKAIFAWAVFGISLATVLVFPRIVWPHLTIRNLAIAAASTIVGALPLVIYNIERPLDTVKSNTHRVGEPFAPKVDMLENTLSGGALFGFFTSVDLPPRPGDANTRWLKVSQAVSEAAHHPTRNFTIWAVVLSCLGLFARASRKPVLFGLLACAGTWLPMVLTAGAGAAAHHVILIWPFPFLAIAATLAAIPWRAVSAAATLLLCASNLALTNEYYWEMVRNGPAIRWTDADSPLEQRLEILRPPDIYIVDWGIYETIRLLSNKTAPLQTPDWSDTESLRKIVSDPRAVFVAHTPEYAYMPQQRAILEEAAASAGYEEVRVEIVYDHYGRATFEVFRFRKIPL
jgi:4-amino-4-deoxy-L-arabinose transferase-like glycosyltransferase